MITMLQRRIQSANTLLRVWNKITVPCACIHKARRENHYEVLGVPLFASEQEIKAAFIELSKKYHPDANTNDKTLHEKYVKISAAYNVLSSASEKEIYDEGLKAGLDDNTEKDKASGQASSKQGDGPKQGFYEHPDYYDSSEMRKKAAEFWQMKTSKTQSESTKQRSGLTPEEKRSSRHIVYASLVLSLGLLFLFSRTMDSEPSKNQRFRDSHMQFNPKHMSGRSGRRRDRNATSEEDDLTEENIAGTAVYLDQKELKS